MHRRFFVFLNKSIVIEPSLVSVRRHSKVTLLALYILILTGTLLGYESLTKNHIWGDDFASYVMQAESVADLNPRQFLEANQVAMSHTDNPGFPLAYPWGAPVLIAPAYALFGLDIHALKLPNLICFLLFLPALTCLFQAYHSSGYLLFLVSFFSVSPLMFDELNAIGSDLPFLCASTISMFLIDFTVMRAKRLIRTSVDAAIVGASIAFAITMRANGWLLLLPLLVAQVSRLGRGNHAHKPLSMTQLCLPYLSISGILIAWSLMFSITNYSFSSIPAMTFGLFTQNLATYYLLPSQLFNDSSPRWLWFLYVSVMGFAALGVLADWRKTPHFVVYMGATLCLYLLWPFYQGMRFVLPILPFFFHFVFVGVRSLGNEMPTATRRVFYPAIVSGAVLLILSLFSTSVARAVNNSRHEAPPSEGPYSPNANEMFAFISTHTKPDDKIIFFKPRLMRLRTGRPSFQPSNVGALEYAEYVCIYKAAVGDPDRWLTASNIGNELVRHEWIRPVFENKDFMVGQVLKRDAHGAIGPHDR